LKKRVFILLLILTFLLPSRVTASGASAFLNWMSGDCFDVHIKLKGCIKIKHGHVKFGLKVTYWLPIGIMEVTDKACDFSLGIFPFNTISAPISAVCNSLPFLQSSGDMNSPLYQSYARYQVHVYTIPPALYPIIKQALMTAHFVPCLDFGFDDVLKICSTCQQLLDKALAPVEAVQGKVNQFTQQIKDKVNSLVPDGLKSAVSKLKGSDSDSGSGSGSGSGEDTDYISAVKEAYSKVMTVASYNPVWFSELVSPIWNVDTLSPDAYTIAPVISAVVGSGGILTEGACDLSTTLFQQKLAQLSVAGVDPSFVCVGNWGHGYPRIGVVRHDNPLVGLPLAGARFLHLFSTTIPFLSNLDVHSIKLQYVKPVKTGCFGIGDHSIPFKVGSNEGNILNLLDLNWNSIDSLIESAKQEAIDFFTADSKRHRAVFLIWKKFSCCDW